MIIENLSVKNKFIHFENQKMELNHIGIYIIRGKNGVGKSSIIRQIVFDKNNVIFNTEEQKNAYYHNRGGLIAYVPQNIAAPNNMTVLEYVKKENKNIINDDVRIWLDRFHMQDISFKMLIKKLSGGERTKLCIISAILKNTPYIFMDEPTNNLDNGSVNTLKSVIYDLGKKKTVVIISHDERMTFKSAHNILVQDNKIVCQNAGKKNDLLPQEIKEKHRFFLSGRIKSGVMDYIAYFVCILCIAGLAFFNHLEYSINYCKDTLPTPGNILIYQTDYVYGELNEMYVRSQNFVVDDYYSMIQYNDIYEIANLSGINNIFILDECKYDQIMENIDGLEQITLVSVPEIIYENYLNQTGLWELFTLKKGKYPRDGENEIVMSEGMIKKLYNVDDVNDFVGQMINYEGIEYKLVGITPFDIAWVSYSVNDNLLFYSYSENSYDNFVKLQIKGKELSEYSYVAEVDCAVLLVENKSERDVLNYLMKNYSANNYDSYIYSKNWIKEYNKGFYLKLLIIDLGVVILLCTIVSFFIKSTIDEDILRIKDYINYYLENKRIIQAYLINRIIKIVFVILAEVVCVSAVMNVCSSECLFLLLDGGIIVLVWCINAVFKIRKAF